MPHIDVPADVPGIRALLAFRPETAEPLGALADALLHAPNSLTPGERELIAAYVSSLNACTFCWRSHAAIAACHLGDEVLVESVIASPEDANVSEKMKALLAVAARVQLGGRWSRQKRSLVPVVRSNRRRNPRHRADCRRVLHVQSLCRWPRCVDADRSGCISRARCADGTLRVFDGEAACMNPPPFAWEAWYEAVGGRTDRDRGSQRIPSSDLPGAGTTVHRAGRIRPARFRVARSMPPPT